MITLMSWGNKFGSPPANFKFDVSYFKNPWRDENIRNEKDRMVRSEMAMKFMRSQEGVVEFIEGVSYIISNINSKFQDENIVVALCCSAGEYRSPAMVMLLNDALNRLKINNIIKVSLESKL